MAIKDYQSELTNYSTNCRCEKTISWVAPFNLPLPDLEELVLENFKWTLFPSRCPDCKGTKTVYGEN